MYHIRAYSIVKHAIKSCIQLLVHTFMIQLENSRVHDRVEKHRRNLMYDGTSVFLFLSLNNK